MAALHRAILLLSAFLLLVGAASAAPQHCCDYSGPSGTPYGFHCENVSADCVIEASTSNLCIEGPGAYQARDLYPPPPNTSEIGTAAYFCIAPGADNATMDDLISGGIIACDQETDCSAADACHDSGDASADADGDGDADVCFSGAWHDCDTDAQCAANVSCCPDHDCGSCKAEKAEEIVGVQGPRHLAVVRRVLAWGGRIVQLIISVFR